MKGIDLARICGNLVVVQKPLENRLIIPRLSNPPETKDLIRYNVAIRKKIMASAKEIPRSFLKGS